MTITGDLVNEETINREVNGKGSPIRGGYSTSIDAENDLILNSYILADTNLENNFKTDSNFKESKPSKIRKHDEQIGGLIGSLNNHSKSFHGASCNIPTGVEII